MTINPFRDQLMTTHFDIFKSLIKEINDIKADLKNQRRRVNKPIGTYIAYVMIRQVSSPISKIFNYKRYGCEISLEMFSSALLKLDLLIREMLSLGRNSLAKTLSHIYTRLFNLLPEDTVIQHQLFDADAYQTDSKKPPTTIGFIKWLQNYHLNGFVRRDVCRRRAFKPLKLVQPSIRLSTI